MAQLVAKRSAWGYTQAAVDAMTEIEIVEFRVRSGAGSVLTIKTLGVDGEVQVTPAPEVVVGAGYENALPATGDAWNKDEIENATITVMNGVTTINAPANNDNKDYGGNILVDKTISVASGAIYYDVSSTGSQCDIVIYVTNNHSNGGHYVYLAEAAGLSNTDFNGKGVITGQRILDLLRAKTDSEGKPNRWGYAEDTAELTIKEFRIRSFKTGSVLTINDLHFGEHVNVLPENKDGWNLDELGDTVKVTVEADGTHKIDATTNAQGLKYGANIIVDQKITVANGAIYYDLATTGGECDIVIYVDEGPNGENGTGTGGHYVYFSNFGLTTANFNGKGVITGQQILKALLASKGNRWNYAINTEELTIKELRIRTGSSAVLTINELALTTVKTHDLVIGEEQENALPATADGWNKDEIGDNVTVSIVEGASKIDASAHTGTDEDAVNLKYSANIIVNKTISVANGAIYYDVATTGGECDIVIYVTNGPNGENGTGSGGHYVYFHNFNGLTTANFNGKGIITAQQILDALIAKVSGGVSNPWDYKADTAQLKIVEFRVRSGAGSVLTINDLHFGNQVNVLPSEADGWKSDELGDKVSVSIVEGASKIDATHNDQGLKYGAEIVTNQKISAENGAIYYDLASTGGECDIVVYVKARGDANDKNSELGHYVYFSNFNGLDTNFNGKGVITAQQILDKLVEKRANTWGYTQAVVDAMTEIEIVGFRVRIGDGAVLTINELYFGEVTD